MIEAFFSLAIVAFSFLFRCQKIAVCNPPYGGQDDGFHSNAAAVSRYAHVHIL